MLGSMRCESAASVGSVMHTQQCCAEAATVQRVWAALESQQPVRQTLEGQAECLQGGMRQQDSSCRLQTAAGPP